MDNNINNMISISMPKGCRYMSDYENLLNGELPLDRKFILNKTCNRLWWYISVSKL